MMCSGAPLEAPISCNSDLCDAAGVTHGCPVAPDWSVLHLSLLFLLSTAVSLRLHKSSEPALCGHKSCSSCILQHSDPPKVCSSFQTAIQPAIMKHMYRFSTETSAAATPEASEDEAAAAAHFGAALGMQQGYIMRLQDAASKPIKVVLVTSVFWSLDHRNTQYCSLHGVPVNCSFTRQAAKVMTAVAERRRMWQILCICLRFEGCGGLQVQCACCVLTTHHKLCLPRSTT